MFEQLFPLEAVLSVTWFDSFPSLPVFPTHKMSHSHVSKNYLVAAMILCRSIHVRQALARLSFEGYKCLLWPLAELQKKLYLFVSLLGDFSCLFVFFSLLGFVVCIFSGVLNALQGLAVK